MLPPSDVASQLLNIELKLKAYQTLHEEELAELWKALNQCKRSIVASLDEAPARVMQLEQTEEQHPG